MLSLLEGNVWKYPKWQFNFCSPNHKTQTSTLQRQCEITIFVTNKNIHYTLLQMAYPNHGYSQTDAPKSQDCYNPLIVRQSAPCGLALQLGVFRVSLCTFQENYEIL